MTNPDVLPIDIDLQHQLEKLFVNNSELSTITSHVARFNPIKVMGMERMEIRHSNILGWLLDPRENHGLGDAFLRSFLSQAMRGQSVPPNSLNIEVRNLADTNVYVEWNHIDILIEVPHAQMPWCFIVENKVYSRQHSAQLERYRSYAESRFPKHKLGKIFLTLEPEEAQDETYVSLSYADIAIVLGNVLAEFQDSLASKVYNFIAYYLEVVTELCEMSTPQEDTKKLARKLYQEHRKALDFIYEHGISNEFQVAAQTLLGDPNASPKAGDEFSHENQHFELTGFSKRWFTFVPIEWSQIFLSAKADGRREWPGCERWRSRGEPVACWFEFKEHNSSNGAQSYSVNLVVEVGPLEDADLRKLLVQSIESAGVETKEIKFTVKSFKAGTKYSKCLTLKGKIEDPQSAEEITEQMRKLLVKFEKVEYRGKLYEGIQAFVNRIKSDTAP